MPNDKKKKSTPKPKNKSTESLKMEAASEVGVNLANGYNGSLTSKEAGSVGGQMVKKMVDSYKGKKGN